MLFSVIESINISSKKDKAWHKIVSITQNTNFFSVFQKFRTTPLDAITTHGKWNILLWVKVNLSQQCKYFEAWCWRERQDKLLWLRGDSGLKGICCTFPWKPRLGKENAVARWWKSGFEWIFYKNTFTIKYKKNVSKVFCLSKNISFYFNQTSLTFLVVFFTVNLSDPWSTKFFPTRFEIIF